MSRYEDFIHGIHPIGLPGEDYNTSSNNGGSSDWYKLPIDATELQDLIEYKQMNFALGNIFKAVYRMNSKNHHSNDVRDLRKIIWFAEREIMRLLKDNEND